MLNCEITEQKEKRRTAHCCTTIQPFRSYCQNGNIPSFFLCGRLRLCLYYVTMGPKAAISDKKGLLYFCFIVEIIERKIACSMILTKQNRDDNKAGHLEICSWKKTWTLKFWLLRPCPRLGFSTGKNTKPIQPVSLCLFNLLNLPNLLNPWFQCNMLIRWNSKQVVLVVGGLSCQPAESAKSAQTMNSL